MLAVIIDPTNQYTMRTKLYGHLLVTLLLLTIRVAQAQENDTTRIRTTTAKIQREKEREERISVLTYTRIISDAHGHYRFDENIVPNFRLNNWLRLEAGIRYGQRTQKFNSFYHYKLELQTKWLWKTVRVLTRISDNVIRYPSPAYRKTNELAAIEGKFIPLHSLQLIGGLGYLVSARQNNNTEALPTRKGDHSNYGIFKVAARYLLPKGFLETSFGSYDTFNPYEPDKPFLQEGFEYELSKRCTTYDYFRYEYNKSIFTPYNYFLSFGLKIRLL
ncbi:hypothetical protein [Ohtaekwangia sp.]|uniref:hypothetical protein n=1 Tax=Ohtaekwangia sp. TaxID=2066019 RepID=UPI002F940FA8